MKYRKKPVIKLIQIDNQGKHRQGIGPTRWLIQDQDTGKEVYYSPRKLDRYEIRELEIAANYGYERALNKISEFTPVATLWTPNLEELE